jgi:hypothetical protein
VRANADGDPEAVLILSTLGAPQRRRLRGRRGRTVDEAFPAPVPTNRATVVRSEPFADATAAEDWLARLQDDDERRAQELTWALGVVNRSLHAYRVANGDGHARDVSARQALQVRLGYGSGDDAVEGRYAAAWELPAGDATKARRSMDAPDERFAALVGAREKALACEELVLRARMDLDAGRTREAALQARVALEALLAELRDIPGDRRGPLEADRPDIGAAANAALAGSLPPELTEALSGSVGRMEAALRARRVAGAVGR